MLAAVLADNRRSAYRVRPIATDNLEIILQWNDQRYAPIEIADVTCKGASVRFTKGTGPKLGKGDELNVAIDTPYLPGGATISARVVFSGESTTERLIGLTFLGAEELVAKAGENFFELFNRRVAYRDSDSSPTTRVAATIAARDAEHAGVPVREVSVRNISTTGICLVVGEDADRFLQHNSFVSLNLKLPGGYAPSAIITRVCYRTALDGKVYFGCHFDWHETPESRRILEAITEYTHDRFDEDLVLVNH